MIDEKRIRTLEAKVNSINGGSSDSGQSATVSVSVGQTTTGAAGTAANVTNSGTPQNVVLDFTIPRGEKGEKGATGPQGPRGLEGASTSVSIVAGTHFTESGTPTITERGTEYEKTYTLDYMKGPKGDTGPQGPTGPKGETGPQGQQGTNGTNGTNGKDGLGIFRSSASATTSTTSLAISTITVPTGHSLQVGDLLIAGSYYLFRITKINTSSGTVAVTYLNSIRGSTGPQGATGPQGPQGPQGPKGEDGGVIETEIYTIKANLFLRKCGNVCSLVSIGATLSNNESNAILGKYKPSYNTLGIGFVGGSVIRFGLYAANGNMICQAENGSALTNAVVYGTVTWIL